MVDGGEGFTEALIKTTMGEMMHLEVMGPVREPISSHWGFLGSTDSKTAVVEMAAAAGLSLVPSDQRNPMHTTSFGVGELIKAALNRGVTSILLGCGDSGTCDGGVGMAQALGARFFTTAGDEIPQARGGASLGDLATADLSGLHPRLKETKIDVACNWHNILCGPKGVARVFGPQKGATPSEVELLEVAMDRVASVVGSILGKDISLAPGSGASGGMGAGLMLIGAELHPRFDIIQKFLNISTLVQNTDICFTAEGGIDEQTPRGKIPAHVAHIAKAKGVPVIALAGTVGVGARANYDAGIDAYASILQGPSTLQMAIQDAERLLTDAAESAMRMVVVGQKLSGSKVGPATLAPARLPGRLRTPSPRRTQSLNSEAQWTASFSQHAFAEGVVSRVVQFAASVSVPVLDAKETAPRSILGGNLNQTPQLIG